MNNEEKNVPGKSPLVEKFFTGFGWDMLSLFLIIAGYVVWFKVSPDYGPEEALTNSLAIAVVMFAATVYAGIATGSAQVVSRAHRSWFLWAAIIMTGVLTVSGAVVLGHYKSADAFEQYAKAHFAGTCEPFTCTSPIEAGEIHVNRLKQVLADQDKLRMSLARLDQFEQAANEIEPEQALSDELFGELNQQINAKRAVYKAKQLPDLELLRQFVNASFLVCKDVGTKASPDYVCNPQDMLDYRINLPLQYPRWSKILRWLSVI